jgi:hypothetical protein
VHDKGLLQRLRLGSDRECDEPTGEPRTGRKMIPGSGDAFCSPVVLLEKIGLPLGSVKIPYDTKARASGEAIRMRSLVRRRRK